MKESILEECSAQNQRIMQIEKEKLYDIYSSPSEDFHLHPMKGDNHYPRNPKRGPLLVRNVWHNKEHWTIRKSPCSILSD